MIIYQLVAIGIDALMENRRKQIFSKKVFYSKSDAIDYIPAFRVLVTEIVDDTDYFKNLSPHYPIDVRVIELELA